MQDLNDKITGNFISAAEWNQMPSEIQNVIENTGQTLSGGDLNQLGKGIANYSANSTFYTDSGAADAYVLTKIGSKQSVTAYTDGMRASFNVDVTNTGASTVNVDSLGAKNIVYQGVALNGGELTAGLIVNLIFDSANDRFELIPALNNFIATDGSWNVNGALQMTAGSGAGIAATDGTFHVHTATAGTVSAHVGADDLVIENSAATGLSILAPDASTSSIYFGSPTDNIGSFIEYQQSTAIFRITTGLAGGQLTLGSGTNTEAARFDASQNFLIGKTALNFGTAGIDFRANGLAQFVHDSAAVINANRLTNDGDVYAVYQDGTLEGAVQVSGTTVSIRGAHLSFLTQLSTSVSNRRSNIKRGTVMEYINERCEWFYEDWEEAEEGKPLVKKRLVVDSMQGTGKGIVTKKSNEQTMRTKVSDTIGTKKAAGVFDVWHDDNAYDNRPEDNNTWDYDFSVATTGDFVIRVTGPCEIGDLLESNGDGTAIVQADNIIKSSTIAKVTQDFTTTPINQENPELVPCQLLNG